MPSAMRSIASIVVVAAAAAIRFRLVRVFRVKVTLDKAVSSGKVSLRLLTLSAFDRYTVKNRSRLEFQFEWNRIRSRRAFAVAHNSNRL